MKVSLTCLIAASTVAMAAQADAQEVITVTASKIPEAEQGLPFAITTFDGSELDRRGAKTLRDALVGSSGVEVQPGGDTGPAGYVLSLQGLAELDAYLLLVDGVPYGGAFNPITTSVDLSDVARVELLKGPAPVTRGATSFVGVANVMHHDAGKQPSFVDMSLGTRQSYRAAVGTSFGSDDGISQSLLASADGQRFSQDRANFHRMQGLYRIATAAGSGRLHADLMASSLDQSPYSPHPREGSGLSTRFVKDANVNPTDARLDQDRLQANLGYDIDVGSGVQLSALTSVAKNWANNIRGFLRESFATDGVTVNADGYSQDVETTEAYADVHIGQQGGKFDWIVGGDWLHGSGHQSSENFEYAVLPDGSNAPDSDSLNVDERTRLSDKRNFLGLYAQAFVHPVERLTLAAGARLNHTDERRCGAEAEGDDPFEESECERSKHTKLTGSVGADFAVWQQDGNQISLFGNYRHSFKPAAIDFGPEAEAEILKPERTRGWQAGIRGRVASGKLEFEGNWFSTRFDNLVIRENIDGLPGLANAGKSKLKGVEFEADAHITPDFDVIASYGHHIAKFTDYGRLRPDGSIQQLAGNFLELSPKDVGAVVAGYAPEHGLQLSGTLRYTGSRWLNKSNTVKAHDFATVDGRIGWRGDEHWAVFVSGENLTGRRDAVVESELGDAQFYRLSGRRVLATLETHL